MMMRDPQKNRKRQIVIMVVVVFFIFVARLFYLQIINEDFGRAADRNSLRNVVQHPARGLIFDRNGVLIVHNVAVYDLMVIPGQVRAMDTAMFCSLIGISIEDFRRNLDRARRHSRFASSLFEAQLSTETFGRLQEHMFRFPGFYVVPRTVRGYAFPAAAHVLGYIGEVDQRIIDNDPYYRMGDYIGKSGLELAYERYLRGLRGNRVLLVDVHNRVQGSFRDGAHDVPSRPGLSLQTTLDIEIQMFAEQLMQNMRGSIVAIEPATGEVLVLVSSPGFDPNLLVGRPRSANFRRLQTDPQRPLFNRALQAEYPPGSHFKIPVGLIALQQGVITPNTTFPCDQSQIGCRAHRPVRGMRDAQMVSCNPFFLAVMRRSIQRGVERNIFLDSRIGLEEWNRYVRSFGLGEHLGIDLPGGRRGLIPTVELYDRMHGENRWAFSTFRSVSIGQGEVGITPLQMANLAAISANRGWFITPHLVRTISDTIIPNTDFVTRRYTMVDSIHFCSINWGMYDAVHAPGGTAWRARIPGISVVGKTGTVQNPHGENHSTFIAFAPFDNPKIAVAVFVENAGFGGAWAAPIASLVIEKYLTREIRRTDAMRRIKDANFLTTAAH